MAKQKKAPLIIILLTLAFAALLFTFACCVRDGRTTPVASRGVLDLSGWDIERDGPVNLNGQWAFYWKKLVDPGELESGNSPGPSGFINVPGSWESFAVDGKTIGGDGYATLRLTVITGPQKLRLGLRLGDIESSYRVFINGSLLTSVGKVGTSAAEEAPDFKTHVVGFSPGADRFDIVLHVSNYFFIQSGILRSIVLGREWDLNSQREKRLLLEFIFIGILLVMGVYHFSIFWLRKYEQLPLYFGLICIFLAVRILNKGERFFLNMFPDFGYFAWSTFNYSIDYAVGILFIMFFYRLFGSAVSKKLIYAFVGSFLFLIVAGAILPYKIESVMGETVAHVPSMLALLYGLYVSARLVIRGEPGSRLYLAGIVAIVAAQVLEFLYGMLFTQVEIRQYHGMMVFVLLQAFSIAKGYSDAFDENLALKNGLEQKVAERTVELQVEKNKLYEKSIIIEYEIALARKIQSQLIPGDPPAPYLSALYRPMEELGGDFFDFIRFDDSDRIGIFLSDVTGHGVPAAFITSMIKTVLLQAGSKARDPAELLMYMNEVLHNQTAENFVTAFYGIYDPADRSLRYANAGHYHPYVITREEVSQIKGNSNTALSVFPNSRLMAAHKGFENRAAELAPGSKLLLYTDGLLEARPVDGNELFEESRLEQVLKENHAKASRDFLDALLNELLAFRKSPHFEDDICLICVDVL